jgi:hypothetical protein
MESSGSRPYTARGDTAFDERVEADLEVIASRLNGDFPGAIEALVLVGSFGRGEGTVVVRSGEACPIHDYDVVIVARDDLPRDRLSWAAHDLAARVGLPHVDLFSYRRGQLPALGVSLFALDLKTAGRVFHGEPSVLAAVRAFDPAEISIDEARRLLFSRLGCLLESVQEADFHRSPDPEDAFRIAYMASKVILCSVEALLIEAGEYHPGLREREARFAARFKRYPQLLGLVKAATAIKLRGGPASFDVIRYWLWARRFYLVTLFRIVCRSYETPLADWWDLASYYNRWFYFLVRKGWNRLFDRAKYEEWLAIQKRVKLELAEIFLELARDSRENVRGPYLTAARDHLTAVTGRSSPMDWEEARRLAVEWDFRILHPH